MAVDNSRASVASAPAPPLFSCLSWLIVFSLFAFTGCSSAPKRPPTGTADPDRFLFERGTAELNDKDWFTAREYFRQLVDSYPQSPFRGDAKLGIGDTHLGEGTTEGYVLAINEYKEFLSLFPTHKRVDYGQYKLAMSHFYQMRDPMRDQTETVEAIKELMVFVERFPSAERSPLYPDAQAQAPASQGPPRRPRAGRRRAVPQVEVVSGRDRAAEDPSRQGPAVHPAG